MIGFVGLAMNRSTGHRNACFAQNSQLRIPGGPDYSDAFSRKKRPE